MALYANTQDFWYWMNGFTYVTESVFTTNAYTSGAATKFRLKNGNVISGSFSLLTNGSNNITTSVTTAAGNYTVSLDDGVLTINSVSALTGTFLWADYKFGTIPDSQIAALITDASAEADRSCGRTFSLTTTTENLTIPIDAERRGEIMVVFTRYYPHVGVPTVSRNDNRVADSASWVSLSSGVGADFLSTTYDQLLGRFRIIDTFPKCGVDRLQAVYTYGYSSGAYPSALKKLTLYYALKEAIINPSFTKAVNTGKNTFIPLNIEMLSREIDKYVGDLRRKEYRVIA